MRFDTEKAKFIFRVHALKRMAERGFSPQELRAAIAVATVVEDYPNDTPYPSALMLGWISLRPVHVVSAWNEDDQECIIITVYEPDPVKWYAGYTRRKP
jgi:hypothetical protein